MFFLGWFFDDIDILKYFILYVRLDIELFYYLLIIYFDGGFIISIFDMVKYLSELIKGYVGNGILFSVVLYKELFIV